MSNKITYLPGVDIAFEKSDVVFPIGEVDIRIASNAFRKHGVVALEASADNHAAQAAFDEMYRTQASTRKIDEFNGVNFCLESALNPDLLAVEANDTVLRIVSEILKEEPTDLVEPAILGSKLIVKDKRFEGAVFLHQDSCYQLGRRKVTGFFLLSDLRQGPLRESTVRILVGTHKFGHLGDAGEINRDILEENWPEFEMSLGRHSYILMDPHCWHYSNAALLGDQVRGIYTFTYAEMGAICSRAPGKADIINANPFTENRIFNRSRVSRIKELQAQLNSKTSADK